MSDPKIEELRASGNLEGLADYARWLSNEYDRLIRSNGILLESLHPKRPTIVCLCGSTRFSEAFQKANLLETLDGKIVLTIGCDMRSDSIIFRDHGEEVLKEIKAKLDELHLRKIDLADEVLILNVGGYIGESTKREIEYAKQHHKVIRYLERVMWGQEFLERID